MNSTGFAADSAPFEQVDTYSNEVLEQVLADTEDWPVKKRCLEGVKSHCNITFKGASNPGVHVVTIGCDDMKNAQVRRHDALNDPGPCRTERTALAGSRERHVSVLNVLAPSSPVVQDMADTMFAEKVTVATPSRPALFWRELGQHVSVVMVLGCWGESDWRGVPRSRLIPFT